MCEEHQNVYVEILDSSIEIMSVYQSFIEKTKPRAMGLLIGYVDHHNQNKAVKGIHYDMHVSMAENVLLKICKQAQHEFDKSFAIYAAHTKGYIPAGGLCTLVLASANNFKNANDVCAYVGDQIRRRLPIWKLEHYVDGTSAWLPGEFQLKKEQCKHKQMAT
jgi:molybdopterin synthase catalytic subunit